MKKSGSPRERILDAASQLFYAQGVSATGIDEIIAKAGVAKATLYYHFKGKSEIVSAYLHLRDETWVQMFEDSLTAVRASNLPAVADALARWFRQKDFNGCAFINIMAEKPESEWRIIAQTHKSELRHLIEKHCLQGVPRTLRISVASLALLVIEGMIVRFHMTRDPETVNQGRALLEMIASSLGKKAPFTD
jgi:AcrR family transcriptional regulator